MSIFKSKSGKVNELKGIEEIIDEKNLEEREAEAERGGAENRTQPTEEKKGESIENITNEIPPDDEKVDLLQDAESGKDTKRKPTTTITKKGEIPERKNTESEAAKSIREGKEKVKKTRDSKSHAFNTEGICVRCGVHKDFATTDCFGIHLSPATALKVKAGKVNYVGGRWIKVEPPKDDEEGKDDDGKDERGMRNII